MQGSFRRNLGSIQNGMVMTLLIVKVQLDVENLFLGTKLHTMGKLLQMIPTRIKLVGTLKILFDSTSVQDVIMDRLISQLNNHGEMLAFNFNFKD